MGPPLPEMKDLMRVIRFLKGVPSLAALGNPFPRKNGKDSWRVTTANEPTLYFEAFLEGVMDPRKVFLYFAVQLKEKNGSRIYLLSLYPVAKMGSR